MVPMLLCPPLQKVLGWIHAHVDEFTRHSTSAISHVMVSDTLALYSIGQSETSVSVEKAANDTFELQ